MSPAIRLHRYSFQDYLARETFERAQVVSIESLGCRIEVDALYAEAGGA